MLLQTQHPLNKSITCSVLGLSNVGKSSLVNYLLGSDLSVVAEKPQTTRNRFHCVFTVDHTEIILVDTPGLHEGNQEINRRMNQQARDGCQQKGINLLLIDATRSVSKQIHDFVEKIQTEVGEVWPVFTKLDLLESGSDSLFEEMVEEIKKIIPQSTRHFSVSSKTGQGMHLLIGAICDEAMEGPHLYDDDCLSNKSERFFAAEYIREQAFLWLSEELPYHLTVLIEDFKTLPDKRTGDILIKGVILVNRPSQRAIVVGKKGEMIKKIGMGARLRIEEMVGHPVHLNLHVKVSPRWFKNNLILEQIGLTRAVDSSRVWRQK